jgi:Fe-Mn family superoxide dismutase
MKAAFAGGVLGMSGTREIIGEDIKASGGCMGLEDAFGGGVYKRPELGYGYDELEPYYGKENLRIHHQKHHSGYVKGLNSTVARLKEVRKSGDTGSIKSLSRALAFHGSGHVLHSLFWRSMRPGGSEMPEFLGEAMAESFGSVEAGKEHFAAATKAVEASGWGVLAYEPVMGGLIVLQAEKHQDLAVWGVVPLLVCDVWEHAYYLKYANERGKWVDNFMKIADWSFANKRLAAVCGS